MKQKNLLIALVAVFVLIIVGGGYFAYTKISGPKATPTPTPAQEQILTLQPDDVGLSLSMITIGKFANNGVNMKITKLSDISSLDYELDYTAAGGIPRGAIGHIDIKSTDATFNQELPFGTCSDKCHFDTGVTGVKLILKITKKDGKNYSIEAPFNQ